MSNDEDWTQESNPINIFRLVKSLEELGELSGVINVLNLSVSNAIMVFSRSLVQGIDQTNPVTGEVNLETLYKVIADVKVQLDRTADHFQLDREAIQQRCDRKNELMDSWEADIRARSSETLQQAVQRNEDYAVDLCTRLLSHCIFSSQLTRHTPFSEILALAGKIFTEETVKAACDKLNGTTTENNSDS